MKRVEVSAGILGARADVHEALTPESIVEYEGTYEVEDVTRAAEEYIVVASNDEIDETMTLSVTERPEGYEYELLEGSTFEELYTDITIAELDARTAAEHDVTDGGIETAVRVTIRSKYTFGGVLSPVYDRLAAGKRRKELRRLLRSLGAEVDGQSTGSTDGSE